jgi:hypothetical protein
MIFREDIASGWQRLAVRVERRRRFENQWFLRVGRLSIFVEGLRFATNKGRTLLVECVATGRVIGCRLVLEKLMHLSCPFLFEWGGAQWMLPEAGASGLLTLYRFERFPGRWVKHRVLVEGLRSADPALRECEDRWRLFLNVTGPGQSIHDSLNLYLAPGPLGPFEPHPINAVRRKPTDTRPAGPLFRWQGALYRPAGTTGGSMVGAPSSTASRGWIPRCKRRLSAPRGNQTGPLAC